MSNGPRPLSRVAELPRYTAARAGLPEGAVYLASNESLFDPLPSVADAIAREAARVHRYPDMHADELRESLAVQWGTSSDAIVVGTGSVGILQQIIAAYAGPGDTVVYPWRSFEAYPLLISAAGATGVAVPLTGSAELDLPALRDAVDARTRVVLLCLPNNPTGTMPPATAIRAFVEGVPSDVLVVVDEAYAEFVEPSRRLDTRALLHAHPHVVVARTFSKAYGLAGLRIGYAAAPEPVADALRRVFLPFGVGSLAQAAALSSLAASDELAERVAHTVARRAAVSLRVEALGWEVPRSQANFVWIPTEHETAGVAAALRSDGVVVRPFAEEGIRVTIGSDVENEKFLSSISRWRRS